MGPSEPARWRLLPLLAVRTTGFEVELVEALRFPESVAAVAPVLAVDRELAALARWLPDAVRKAADAARRQGRAHDARELARCRRRLAAGEPLPEAGQAAMSAELATASAGWNALLARRQRLCDAARRTFDDELRRQRHRLRETVARVDVREALLLLSPAVRVAADRYLATPVADRTTRTREIERRLMSYLQRLAVKNETNSFFGPVNYGRIDPQSEPNLRLRRTGELAGRVTFAAQWVVQELADAIAADPSVRPHLRPRRGVRGVPPAAGDRSVARLYALSDGGRSVAQLAAVLGEEWPRTWRRASELAEAGFLVTGLLVPPDLSDPLRWLLGWLSGLPADCPARRRWQPVAAGLAARIAAFATAGPDQRPARLAELEQEFQSLGQRESRRHGGQMYADRGLLYEECRGDLASVVFGGAVAADLTTRLEPVLRLAETEAVRQWQRDQRAATALWRRLAGPDGSPVPIRDYLRELAARPIPAGGGGEDAADELDAYHDQLRQLVRKHSDGRVARLRGDDLPAPPAVAAVPEPAPWRLTSLDLMIEAAGPGALARGDYRLVVGEVHPQPLIWAFPTGHFLTAEQRRELDGALRAVVAAHPAGAEAVSIAHTRSSKVYPYPLPGRVMELRPRLPTTGAIPISDVEVRPRDGGVCWWSDRAGWLRLYPPLRRRHDRLDPVAPFAFPAAVPPLIDCGEYTPRVEVDGVVLQRERWVLAGSRFGRPGDDFDRFLAAWRFKQRHGLPDRVFVRVPHERKPVFVDFANAFLVELFAYLCRPSTTVVVTEALPDLDRQWLAGPRGRHTCELRTIAVGR